MNRDEEQMEQSQEQDQPDENDHDDSIEMAEVSNDTEHEENDSLEDSVEEGNQGMKAFVSLALDDEDDDYVYFGVGKKEEKAAKKILTLAKPVRSKAEIVGKAIKTKKLLGKIGHRQVSNVYVSEKDVASTSGVSFSAKKVENKPDLEAEGRKSPAEVIEAKQSLKVVGRGKRAFDEEEKSKTTSVKRKGAVQKIKQEEVEVKQCEKAIGRGKRGSDGEEKSKVTSVKRKAAEQNVKAVEDFERMVDEMLGDVEEKPTVQKKRRLRQPEEAEEAPKSGSQPGQKYQALIPPNDVQSK